MSSLQIDTFTQVAFTHKKIKYWTNQHLSDWIQTIGLTAKWQEIMTHIIKSTNCAGKDWLEVANAKGLAKALNIKQPMLANRVFREFKKMKQKQLNDNSLRDEEPMPLWMTKHINEWTCDELQQWIHSLSLQNRIKNKVTEAIAEQEITGLDFNSLEEIADVMDSFEIEKTPSAQIFSSLQKIRTKIKGTHEMNEQSERLARMKNRLKQLQNVETQINSLDQQSAQMVSRLKTTTNAQIEKAKEKLTNTVKDAIDALRAKEKQMLDELNRLIESEERKNENEDTTFIKHSILKETMDALCDTKQLLLNNMKEYDANGDIFSECVAFEEKAKANLAIVQSQIEYCTTRNLCSKNLVSIQVDEDKYAELINSIESIATVQIKKFFPLHCSNNIADRNKKRLWNEMTTKKYRTLMDWLQSNGSLFANCKQKQLNGIYATTDGNRGMLFATIPLKCIMTVELAKSSQIGQKLRASYQTIASAHIWIAAYLLFEKKKGNQSFWFPFFDMLPTQFNTIPIYFNEGEMKQLKGSMTIQKIEGKIQMYQRQYNSLREVFQSENISFEEFVWARTVVITRVFGMTVNDNKTSGLVPFADLFDHTRSGRNVLWNYENEQSAFIVQSTCNIDMGDELFVTYGKKCNSRFFVNYGFISDTKNEANEAKISLNICKLAVSDNNLEIKKMQKINLLLRSSNTLKCGYEISFTVGNTYETQQCLSLFGMSRLMSCDEKEIDAIQPLSMETIQPLSMENERKALKLISYSAQLALNGFDTLLCEDNLLRNNMYALNSNKRNITLMVKGEKQILQIYAKLYSQFIQRNKLNMLDSIQLKGYKQELSVL